MALFRYLQHGRISISSNGTVLDEQAGTVLLDSFADPRHKFWDKYSMEQISVTRAAGEAFSGSPLTKTARINRTTPGPLTSIKDLHISDSGFGPLTIEHCGITTRTENIQEALKYVAFELNEDLNQSRTKTNLYSNTVQTVLGTLEYIRSRQTRIMPSSEYDELKALRLDPWTSRPIVQLNFLGEVMDTFYGIDSFIEETGIQSHIDSRSGGQYKSGLSRTVPISREIRRVLKAGHLKQQTVCGYRIAYRTEWEHRIPLTRNLTPIEREQI